MFGQRRLDGQLPGEGIEPQGRITIEGLQQALHQLGAEPGGLEAGHQLHRQGQHLLLPVVVDHLGDEVVAAGLDPQLGGAPRLQGLALQGAPAEAVDRGDIGGVEVFEGQQQPPPQQGRLLGGTGQKPSLQPVLQGGIGSGAPIGWIRLAPGIPCGRLIEPLEQR